MVELLAALIISTGASALGSTGLVSVLRKRLARQQPDPGDELTATAALATAEQNSAERLADLAGQMQAALGEAAAELEQTEADRAQSREDAEFWKTQAEEAQALVSLTEDQRNAVASLVADSAREPVGVKSAWFLASVILSASLGVLLTWIFLHGQAEESAATQAVEAAAVSSIAVDVETTSSATASPSPPPIPKAETGPLDCADTPTGVIEPCESLLNERSNRFLITYDDQVRVTVSAVDLGDLVSLTVQEGSGGPESVLSRAVAGTRLIFGSECQFALTIVDSQYVPGSVKLRLEPNEDSVARPPTCELEDDSAG